MPDQLFTFYMENTFLIISINCVSCGVVVVCLEIETWVNGEGGTKRHAERGVWREEVWGLLGFKGLVCVWVYF
jgi:hypothetical protein